MVRQGIIGKDSGQVQGVTSEPVPKFGAERTDGETRDFAIVAGRESVSTVLLVSWDGKGDNSINTIENIKHPLQ